MSETDTSAAPVLATVNDQTHRIVNALAVLSDTTAGLAELLEEMVPDDGGCAWRAVIRLAEAIAADVADAYEKLDHLEMAMPPGIMPRDRPAEG